MGLRKADYRVVADTGSTDDTVKILTRNNVTVLGLKDCVHIDRYNISVKPWRFDTARNAALCLVPADADVCLTLDMDELIDDDFVEKLREVWIPGVTTIATVPFDTGLIWMAQRVHARHGFVWQVFYWSVFD